MDRRNQQPSRDRSSFTQSWKPQSRIAGYINGTAKLEDIYNTDKIVKPQDRHNKRTFHHQNLSPANRNTIPAAQRAAKPRASKSSSKATTAPRPDDSANTLPGSVSVHSQGDTSSQSCASSVKAGSARATSVSSSMRAVNEQLLTEKDEEIAALKDRVEHLLRSLTPPDRDSATADDVTALVDNLFRSLAGAFDAIAHCRADMTDERVEQTLAHMEQSRDHWYTLAGGLSKAVNALHESGQQLRTSNADLDEQLARLRSENATLKLKVAELQAQTDGAEAMRHQLDVMAANEDAIRVENERLLGQIRELEQRHKRAKDEITGCLELHERIEKDTQTKENVSERFAARLKQLESDKNEMQMELRRYRDELTAAEAENAHLKEEPRMLQQRLRRLQDDNEKYQKLLLEVNSQYQRLRGDFEHLQNQKRRLEGTLDEWKQTESNLDTSWTTAIGRLRMMFDEEKSYSKMLMRSLEETALKAKILNENEINTNS